MICWGERSQILPRVISFLKVGIVMSNLYVGQNSLKLQRQKSICNSLINESDGLDIHCCRTEN